MASDGSGEVAIPLSVGAPQGITSSSSSSPQNRALLSPSSSNEGILRFSPAAFSVGRTAATPSLQTPEAEQKKPAEGDGPCTDGGLVTADGDVDDDAYDFLLTKRSVSSLGFLHSTDATAEVLQRRLDQSEEEVKRRQGRNFIAHFNSLTHFHHEVANPQENLYRTKALQAMVTLRRQEPQHQPPEENEQQQQPTQRESKERVAELKTTGTPSRTKARLSLRQGDTEIGGTFGVLPKQVREKPLHLRGDAAQLLEGPGRLSVKRREPAERTGKQAQVPVARSRSEDAKHTAGLSLSSSLSSSSSSRSSSQETWMQSRSPGGNPPLHRRDHKRVQQLGMQFFDSFDEEQYCYEKRRQAYVQSLLRTRTSAAQPTEYTKEQHLLPSGQGSSATPSPYRGQRKKRNRKGGTGALRYSLRSPVRMVSPASARRRRLLMRTPRAKGDGENQGKEAGRPRSRSSSSGRDIDVEAAFQISRQAKDPRPSRAGSIVTAGALGQSPALKSTPGVQSGAEQQHHNSISFPPISASEQRALYRAERKKQEELASSPHSRRLPSIYKLAPTNSSGGVGGGEALSPVPSWYRGTHGVPDSTGAEPQRSSTLSPSGDEQQRQVQAGAEREGVDHYDDALFGEAKKIVTSPKALLEQQNSRAIARALRRKGRNGGADVVFALMQDTLDPRTADEEERAGRRRELHEGDEEPLLLSGAHTTVAHQSGNHCSSPQQRIQQQLAQLNSGAKPLQQARLSKESRKAAIDKLGLLDEAATDTSGVKIPSDIGVISLVTRPPSNQKGKEPKIKTVGTSSSGMSPRKITKQQPPTAAASKTKGSPARGASPKKSTTTGGQKSPTKRKLRIETTLQTAAGGSERKGEEDEEQLGLEAENIDADEEEGESPLLEDDTDEDILSPEDSNGVTAADVFTRVRLSKGCPPLQPLPIVPLPADEPSRLTAVVISVDKYEDPRVLPTPAAQCEDAEAVSLMLQVLGYKVFRISNTISKPSSKEVIQQVVRYALAEASRGAAARMASDAVLRLDPSESPEGVCLVYVVGRGAEGTLHGFEKPVHYLLFPDTKVSSINRHNSLVLEELMQWKGTSTVTIATTARQCVVQPLVMAELLPLNVPLKGLCRFGDGGKAFVAAGKKTYGSDMQIFYPAQFTCGAFTWYLLKALQGDAIRRNDLSGAMINAYIRDRLECNLEKSLALACKDSTETIRRTVEACILTEASKQNPQQGTCVVDKERSLFKYKAELHARKKRMVRTPCRIVVHCWVDIRYLKDLRRFQELFLKKAKSLFYPAGKYYSAPAMRRRLKVVRCYRTGEYELALDPTVVGDRLHEVAQQGSFDEDLEELTGCSCMLLAPRDGSVFPMQYHLYNANSVLRVQTAPPNVAQHRISNEIYQRYYVENRNKVGGFHVFNAREKVSLCLTGCERDFAQFLKHGVLRSFTTPALFNCSLEGVGYQQLVASRIIFRIGKAPGDEENKNEEEGEGEHGPEGGEETSSDRNKETATPAATPSAAPLQPPPPPLLTAENIQLVESTTAEHQPIDHAKEEEEKDKQEKEKENLLAMFGRSATERLFLLITRLQAHRRGHLIRRDVLPLCNAAKQMFTQREEDIVAVADRELVELKALELKDRRGCFEFMTEKLVRERLYHEKHSEWCSTCDMKFMFMSRRQEPGRREAVEDAEKLDLLMLYEQHRRYRSWIEASQYSKVLYGIAHILAKESDKRRRMTSLEYSERQKIATTASQKLFDLYRKQELAQRKAGGKK